MKEMQNERLRPCASPPGWTTAFIFTLLVEFTRLTI